MDAETGGAASPYLARQEAMREFMERALCGNPAECDVNGLYFLSAPTGSGKNYTAEGLAADLVLGGWDRNGCFKKAKGRRNLVFVVPLKANRDDFAANVRELLVDRGMSHEEATRIVIALPGNADGLLTWIDETCGMDIDPRGRIACPFEMKDEAETRRIRAIWNDALDLAAELRAMERRSGKLGIDLGNTLCGLRNRFGRAERTLRRAIARNLKGVAVGSETISQIWPSARLCDRTTPHIIACTPQKLLTRIDTVMGTNAVFFDSALAGESVFIFDEIDHIKGDMTSFLLDQSVKFQPDELLRILDRRFNGGVVDPLLLGDKHQWMALYTTAASDPRYLGSHAATGRVSKGDVLAAAEGIAKSAERLKRAISSCITELGLCRPFAISSEMEMEALAGRHLFGSDDISVSLAKGDTGPLAYAPNADRTRNLLVRGDSGDTRRLDRALRRARRVVRMAVGHLSRCAYVMDDLYQDGALYREGISRKNVIDAFAVRNDETDEKLFWDGLMKALFFQNRKNDEIDAADDSIYARGVSYIAMETNDEHMFTTYLTQQSVERLAESYLASIASCAPCVCMSATWNAPTIKNFNLDYLDEVHGIVRRDGWTGRLNGEIVRQTRLFNEYASRTYRVDVAWVESACAFAGLEPCAGHANVATPDEAIGRAMTFLTELGLGAKTAARMVDEIAQATFGSCREGQGFVLERLGKTLTAVASWAFGVRRGDHYSGAVFTTRHMGNRDEFNALALDLSREIVAELLIIPGNPGLERATALQLAAESVPCFNASGWDEGWRTAETRLKRGRVTLMFINLAAGGFSKNMKFSVPLCLADSVRRIDCGYGAEGRTSKMDLDFIYIESPSCRLTWNVDVDDEKFAQQALMGVVEQEELAVRGEISYAAKRQRVRQLLSSGKRSLNVRETDSFRCEGARIVAQAIGRVMRTNIKMPQVQVLLDRAIAEDCDFSFLEGQPLGYELERVVNAWLSSGELREGRVPVDAVRRQNLAAYRNMQVRERHERLAGRVLRAGAREEDLERFDEERDFYLGHFCMPEDELSKFPAWRSSMLKLPYAVEGYAYAERKDGAPIFEFPLRDGEPVAEAAKRLSRRLPGARVRVVSQESARVPELLSVPAVRGRWERDGVPTGLFSPATRHMAPYAFQAVYLGALGEAAGQAIFEAYFAGEYRLVRGNAGRAERCGDYLVLDSSGGGTGVWIDFKHYRIGAYEQYAGSAQERRDAERYEEKVAAVGAKRVLVVNVLADDAARDLRPKAVGNTGVVYSVPFMAADGTIDIEMMEAIRRGIEL